MINNITNIRKNQHKVIFKVIKKGFQLVEASLSLEGLIKN